MATHRTTQWSELIDDRGLMLERIAERLAKPGLSEQERVAMACQVGQIGLRLCRLSEDIRRGNRPISGQRISDPQPASREVA